VATGLPSAIYPCDTGAHHLGYYAPFLDGVTLPELECGSVEFADQRIVARYFGNNEDYYFSKAADTLVPPARSAIAKAFHRLLTTEEPRHHDDRCLSIEIILNTEVVLNDALRDFSSPTFYLRNLPLLRLLIIGRLTASP
jgi:hypothetical protein